MKNKSLLTTLIIACVLASCQKTNQTTLLEDREQITGGEELLKAENGMLVFPSHNTFLKNMSIWNEMDEDAVTQLLARFDFESYHGDTTANKTVEITPDLLFQKVINKNGAFKISDTIFVLTPSEDVIITDGSLSSYNEVIAGRVSGANIERKKVINNLKVTQEISLTSNRAPNTWYGENNYYSPEEIGNGRPERVRTTLYAQVRSAFGSCGLRIRGEAYRRCGLWCVNWRADEIVQLNVLPNSSYQVNFFTQNRVIPAGSVTNRQETTIFSFPSPGASAPNGDNFGFQNLQVQLSYRKLPHNPLRTISLRVIDGILQPANTNW